MVAKINRGVSLYGAVIYNQRKVDEATARIIAGNRMITDLTGNPHNVMQQTLWAFESYLAANRNTEKPVLHISLNPSVDDRLTDGQFAELAREYMQKMPTSYPYTKALLFARYTRSLFALAFW